MVPRVYGRSKQAGKGKRPPRGGPFSDPCKPCRSTARRRTWTSNLHVEVKGELLRMRPQADLVGFLGRLVLDVRVDHVTGEDVALEEVGVVLAQRLERLVEARRDV